MNRWAMFGCAALVAGAAWWVDGSDVEMLSRGEEVRLEDHVEMVGLTLVEFTADW